MDRSEIEKMISTYYTEKIREFGPIPRGVDWNGMESQNIRFDQLTKLLNGLDSNSSLLDFGCGYGALLNYLKERNLNYIYTGYDLSTEMINAAVKEHSLSNASWTSDLKELNQYDYVIASGIFNVKEQTPEQDWIQFILETLSHLNELAIKGFAFNLLTCYCDEEKKKSNLFYASPTKLFDYCKSNFTKSVTLLHDYPLYEFTILARKNIL